MSEYYHGIGVIIDTPFSATDELVTLSWGEIARRSAKIANAHNSTTGIALAKEGLEEGLNQLNMKGPFFHSDYQETDIPLIANQGDYALGSGIFGVENVALVDNDGNMAALLEGMGWEQSLYDYPRRAETLHQRPDAWTARNLSQDATITLMHAPSTATLETYPEIRVWTTRRITKPEKDHHHITAPLELTDALTNYGRYYVLVHRKPEDTARWQHFLRMSRDAVAEYRAMGTKQLDTPQRMRVALQYRS